MALNLNISSSALKRLRSIDRGKYKSLRDVVAEVKGSSNAEKHELDNFIPINPNLYFGDGFYSRWLIPQLGTRDYGVFLHNLSTYYVAIPNFLTKYKLTPLIKPDDKFMTSFVSKQDKNKLIFAVDGMFHGTIKEHRKWKVVNQVYKNNNPQFLEEEIIIGNYSTWYIQWKGSPDPVLNFGSTVANDPSIPGKGDSMSSFNKEGGIFNGNLDTGGYAEKLGDSGTGKALFAYNSTKDLAFIIVQPDSIWTYFPVIIPLDAQEILKSLFEFGFDNAVFLDGSDSVFLYEYNSKGGGSFLVNSLDDLSNPFKNTPYIGLRVAYSIEKI